MPGLSDLLRNPRRLQQFAETPGNYPAALAFAGAGQGRVAGRAASRASKNEEETGVLETGEVIDKVKLPDGSYVAPATQSGQIVKVPGKSNLFVDPATGEPFQADPTKPTGLRSAYDAARRVARGGKEYAVIPGIGEKEIGPDQKALAKQAEEDQKAKYDLQAEGYYKQNRPFRFRPGSHEPIPRHTDEEWQALQKKKAEEALSEAHVKKLKAQAERLSLDADRLSLTAPKASPEESAAYDAAVSSLESFAAGKDLDTAATELANAPDTQDEDQAAAKATAQSYLALRDKVKPAKDAEAKAKELKLRALDLKEQMLDPDAWKAAKAASLAEMPDADLHAEAKAQADIITEQETEAQGTLELVAKGRADLEQKHAAFMAERQAAEAQGLSLEQKQALDDQQAQLEAEMADYDDWNAEAVTSAQGSLKASQDRREVLAAAGAEIDRRNKAATEQFQAQAEKAAVLEKAKPLYDWAKDNFHYTDDYRGMNDYGILDAEAKKAGLDPKQAREALQTFRQLDWSNPRRDAQTGQPIAEESRLLPDGRVTINPGAWGDLATYTKAVEASGASEAAKKQALEQFPQLQEIYAEKAVDILSKSANIPGQDNFMKWRERKIEEDQAQKGALGFTRKSPARQAIEYMDEMKNRSWFRKAGEQIVSGLLVGSADIATQVLGDAAMLTGSETIADLAAANSANSESVVGAQSLEGSDTDYALRVMGMGARMAPGVAAMIAGAGALGGGMTAASVLSGAQTAGGMFADIYRKAKDEGLSHGEAWRKAALPSAFAGAITGLLTRGMGATGLERVFADPVAKEAAKGAFKTYLGQFAKAAAEELPEETADEFFSQIIQGAAESADPAETLKNYVTNLPELAGVSALMGGAGGLMQGQGNAPEAGPEGMAPMPGEPQAPEPGPVAQAQISQPAQTGDIAGAIKAFTPTGEAMLPQAVTDTVKRTNRTTEDVSRAAASGLVKVSQGASLESLDAREREALGFVSKDGKITPAPKTTPLVETYKGKLVIRNEAAEWLDDEGQPLLARQIRLDEAERKAQIDEAEAKPAAKKKAGQAKPKAAESKSRDSEEVITSGSLPEVTGANPVPATTQPTPANEQGPPTPEPQPAAEAVRPEESAALETVSARTGPVVPSESGLPVLPEQPPAPAPQATPEPEPAAGGGLTAAQAALMTPAEYKAKRKQMTDPAIWSPAVAEFEHKGMIANAIKNGLPFSQEAAKEYGIKAMTPAQAAKATPEQKARAARKAGKATVPASKIQPPVEAQPAPAAVDQAAEQAATSPAAEAKAGPAEVPAQAKPPEQMTPEEFEKIRSGIIKLVDASAMPPKSEAQKKAEFKVQMLEGELKRARSFEGGSLRGVRRSRGAVKTDQDLQTELDAAKSAVASEKAKWDAEKEQKSKDLKKALQEQFPEAFDTGLVFEGEVDGKPSILVRVGLPSSGKDLVKAAVKEQKPVSAAAVDAYGITLPEGYVRQGDLYVYRPAAAPSPAPASQETASQPEAKAPEPAPATPLARAQAALAAYSKAAEVAKKAAKNQQETNTANRKLVGAKHLAGQLAKLEGAVEYEIATAYRNAKIDTMMVIPAGKGGLLAINPAGLLDQITNNNLDAKAIAKAIDKFIVHELIHKAALGRLSDARILDLYNALTPAAKEASRKLYLAQAGENPPPLGEFQAAHEWFAQLVETRMTGEISNQAFIEASDDATFRDRLIALLRDFVAQLRDIAGLVKDKAMAEQIRAEADAVQAVAEAMAAKAGLQVKAEGGQQFQQSLEKSSLGAGAATTLEQEPLKVTTPAVEKHLRSFDYLTSNNRDFDIQALQLSREDVADAAFFIPDHFNAGSAASYGWMYGWKEGRNGQRNPGDRNMGGGVQNSILQGNQAYDQKFGIVQKPTEPDYIDKGMGPKRIKPAPPPILTKTEQREIDRIESNLKSLGRSSVSALAELKTRLGIQKGYERQALETAAWYENPSNAVYNLDTAKRQRKTAEAHKAEAERLSKLISKIEASQEPATPPPAQPEARQEAQAAQADPTLWADVSRFFASMNSDSMRSAAISDLKRGIASDDVKGYLIDLLENPNWKGNARSIAPKLIERLKATMKPEKPEARADDTPVVQDALNRHFGTKVSVEKLRPGVFKVGRITYGLYNVNKLSEKQAINGVPIGDEQVLLKMEETQAEPSPATAAEAKLTPENAWDYMLAPSAKQGVASDYIDGLRVSLANAKTLANDKAATPAMRAKAKNDAAVLIQRIKAEESAWAAIKEKYSAKELQRLSQEKESEPINYKAEMQSLLADYPDESTRPEWVSAQIAFLAKEAAPEAQPTPAQAQAIAKEAAMPEPAKQAAPFDATAAKGQKKFLLAEVAAAVKAAPRRSEMTQEQNEVINILQARYNEIEKASADPEIERLRGLYDAAQADVERLVGYITIEVPGDGTFTILNEKGALAQFQKRADKFPTTAIRDDLPAKPTAQAPTAVPALKKPKTTADVVAAIYPMVSEDKTRPALLKVKGDGTHLWATDGKTLVKVEQENGGGTGNEEVFYDEKGNASPQEEGGGRYDGNQVIPKDDDFTPYTLDTGRWFGLMSQARAVLKTLPGEEDSIYKSVGIYRNTDGSLGVFASDPTRGDYAHNIQPEAKFLASYNPEYMQTILRVARNLGQEQVEMRIQDDVSPATFRAGPALFVLMPMRFNGVPAYSPQAQAARPAPPVTAKPAEAKADKSLKNNEEADILVTKSVSLPNQKELAQIGDEVTWIAAGREAQGTVYSVRGDVADIEYFGPKTVPLSDLTIVRKSPRRLAQEKRDAEAAAAQASKKPEDPPQPKPKRKFTKLEIASLEQGKTPEGWTLNRGAKFDDPLTATDTKGQTWEIKVKFSPTKTMTLVNGDETHTFDVRPAQAEQQAQAQPPDPSQAPAAEPGQGQAEAGPEAADKPPVGYGDEPAPPPITAPGVRYNDIPLELARQAHRGTSFLPDVRARGEQRQYVAYMNDVWEAVSKQADTDEKKAIAKEQFETYRTRYLEKEKDLLRSRAGLLSAMITGPARFPVARAEKRSQAFHNKLKEFLAWDKKAKAAMLGKITPQSSGIISADDPDAPEQIQARIDELKARQEMMKKGNEVIRKNAGNKTAMASALRDLGVPEAEITRVLNPPQGYGLGWQSFTLTNNNANIRRNEERFEKVQKMRSRPARQATFEGGRVEENTEANRVQIFFDAIPAADIRAKLKSNGFKWAPSQGAWQRQRTNAAVYAAESVLGVKMAAPAQEAQAESEPADIGPATPQPLPADEGGQAGLANPPGRPGQEATSDEAQAAELEEAANEAVREAGEILRELQQQGEQEARAKAKDEAARLALANDPKAVRAIGEGEKIDARNPSLIFKNPAARRFYQAILVARAELGMRTYISDKELQDFARKQFDSDPEGVYEWALDKADEGESLNDEEQAVLFELFDRAQADDSPFINRPGFDQEMVKLGHYIRESRGTTGRMLRYGRDRVETPQQRWKRAFYHIKGPDSKQAAMLRIAPSAREKARRIAELEDQLSKASAARRADIEAALAKAKRQKSRAEVLEEITAENERLMDTIIDKMGGVTRDDIMHSPLERYGLQTAILDLPTVREALDKFDNGRDIMRLAFRGFSNEHIAGALQIPVGDVADFIKQAQAAIIRPAVTEQVKAGKTFGDWIKSGLDILARKTGLRQPPSIRPLENWRTLITGKRQTLDEVTDEVNRVMGYALQSQKARDSKKLMSKVINTPTGQRVRIFVPFDPDDATNYYSFAREYSAAKANVFDKFYEYWINWPLLSGPQTQVVNFTGNAAQVAWHYTGQRLAEATLNALVYHDPNSAQLREFWHIIKGFWKSIGPALDMARQSFLTEGDTVRHKFLNEPLQIDIVDGDIDKVGGIRAAVGGKLGRLNRLPGRVLRWTDSFFKTAVLYAEASAVAYRKAHASAKAQGLKGQARRDYIDTEIDNTLKDPQSPVWADVMDTAEELLFQDDNVATAIVDTMLGGYRGVNAFEKALAEAKASGNSKTVAVLNAMIAGAKAVNRIMRFIFPFQRTPTNIIRVGLRKGGGSAIVGLYHLLHGGWLKYKDGTPILESYTKAMQIKDLSETGIAVMGWLMLASMFEGDDDDEKKPFLIVGSRPSSRQGYPEKQAFLNKYGGESSFVWQDSKGNVIASKSFGRYEPIGTLLTTWVDAYRNFQEVRRRQKAGEAASFKTYMLSSFVSGLENKSFLQGLSNVMEWIRDIEERRENPDVDANTKLFLRNVIPNIIKQPLRNWDDVVRETKTAGAGYSALPNPALSPKLPTFAAEPKISTTGQKMRKDLSAPARLLFPANTVVTPQPDALLYRANRLNPTAAKWPSGIQRDEFFYRAPGAKPKTPGYHVPIEDAAGKRRFAEMVGQEYTKEVRNYVASLPPALKARPGPEQIKGLAKAMTEARKKARILYGLQKPKTPAITTSNK